MKNIFRLVIGICLVIGMNISTFAQGGTNDENEYSVNPIPFYEQLYKKRIWSRVDLKQKQNRGFFSINRELTKILIEAIISDSIVNYYNPNTSFEFEEKLTKEEVLKRLIKTQGSLDDLDDYEDDLPYSTEEVVKFDGKGYESIKDENSENNPSTSPDWWKPWIPDIEKYEPNMITKLEIMEDVVFDKRRGREYRDIQSVKLIVTGEYSLDGANYFVVTFAYKDLEVFFKNNPETAIWYNQYNSAENRNLADAFALRLFQGELYRVENPEDRTIADLYGDGGSNRRKGLIMAEILRMKMLEREHNLWSY